MFREFIAYPIDPIPEEYVKTIKRIKNEPDYSLTSLGIAMLKPRIEGYNGISGSYCGYVNKENCVTDFIERVKAIDDVPLFCYYKYSNSNDCQEMIDKQLDGFKEKKSIQAFVKDKMNFECQILYHETMNAVGIFVNTTDARLYHLLLSFVSLYYPALFADNPLTENDYELIKTLNRKTSEEFCTCIRKMVTPYVAEFRRIQLGSFIKQIHQSKIQNAFNDVNSQRNVVAELEDRLADAFEQLRSLIVTYEGMKVTENYDAPEEELVEYLSTNMNVHNIKFRNNTIMFNVSTLLNNYNVDAWNIFSKRGHIYDGEYGTKILDVFENKNNRKIILDSIFSDAPKLMVKMAGNYKLGLTDSRVYTDSYYDYTTTNPMYKSYIPNPHLKLFACLGGYSDKVSRALRDRNYVAAIELCIASAGSVNLDETTQTFRPFLGWILSSTEKVLVNKQGEEFTPEEALVWLIDKEKKDETN